MTQGGPDEHVHAGPERAAPQSEHVVACLACARVVRRQTVSHQLTPASAPAVRRTPEEVPWWREDLPLSVLPAGYRTLMAVLTLPEAAAGLRASTVVALTGREPVRAVVRATRIRLRLLVTRGWALEPTRALFTTAPGPAGLFGVPKTEHGGTGAASHNTVMQITETLANRTAIERAKGMLAQDCGLTVERAYDGLRDYADLTGQGLAELAHALVDGVLATADLFRVVKPG